MYLYLACSFVGQAWVSPQKFRCTQMAVGAEHEVVLLGDEVVDVIEAVGEVGGDLHLGKPRRQDSVARILLVAEAIGQVGTSDEFVNETNGYNHLTRSVT
ncbi:hypothetical protein ACFX12_033924 [Malus domestica]